MGWTSESYAASGGNPLHTCLAALVALMRLSPHQARPTGHVCEMPAKTPFSLSQSSDRSSLFLGHPFHFALTTILSRGSFPDLVESVRAWSTVGRWLIAWVHLSLFSFSALSGARSPSVANLFFRMHLSAAYVLIATDLVLSRPRQVGKGGKRLRPALYSGHAATNRTHTHDDHSIKREGKS